MSSRKRRNRSSAVPFWSLAFWGTFFFSIMLYGPISQWWRGVATKDKPGIYVACLGAIVAYITLLAVIQQILIARRELTILEQKLFASPELALSFLFGNTLNLLRVEEYIYNGTPIDGYRWTYLHLQINNLGNKAARDNYVILYVPDGWELDPDSQQALGMSRREGDVLHAYLGPRWQGYEFLWKEWVYSGRSIRLPEIKWKAPTGLMTIHWYISARAALFPRNKVPGDLQCRVG